MLQGMKHAEGNFKGIRGYSLYRQEWLPDGKPKGIVQIVHGISEHSGRYLHVVDRVVPEGFAAYADDHHGHGKSEGQRCFIGKWDDFVEDERLLKEDFLGRHPECRNLPRFLLGHSMGSLIAFSYIVKYGNDFTGLVLSGFGTRNGSNVSPLLKALAGILSMLLPRFTLNPKLGDGRVTNDEEETEKARNDPLMAANIITARLARELMAAQEKVRSLAPSLKLPLLAQSGSIDTFMLGREEFDGIFTMKDKTIKIYKDLCHEVYNEIPKEREKVLNDLAGWLVSHAR
jgi:acylglycerol lipase